MGSELPLAEVLQFVIVELGLRSEHDSSHHALAPARMRHSDNSGCRDGGVGEQASFYLDGRHVLTPRFDHVLFAVDKKKKIILVEAPEVARMEPSPGERLPCCFGVLEIALHDHRTPVDDLA